MSWAYDASQRARQEKTVIQPLAPAPADVARSAPNAAFRKTAKRQPELDGLRGFLLVWMTLTHLPTHISAYSNQTLGFVSAAEGFIFLSAVLCGRVFGRKLREEGIRSVWRRLGARAGRLYAYHLFLLGIAFTVVARLAIHTKQPSLVGLLDFYLAHPIDGVIASALLVYRPPLLDILPMYILFLIGTPIAFWVSSRWSWRAVIVPSLLLWTAAQLGFRSMMYATFVRFTHVDIPFSALGAFDLFAWQLLWAVGLWIGSGSAEILRFRPRPKAAIFVSLLIAVTMLFVRYSKWWTVLNAPPWAPLTDKWHLGPVRILNFTAVAVLFVTIQPKTVKWLGRGPLVVLGKASLEVFCAHLLVCFAALALVGDGTNASLGQQAGIIVFALIFLYGVAKAFGKEHKNTMQPRRED